MKKPKPSNVARMANGVIDWQKQMARDRASAQNMLADAGRQADQVPTRAEGGVTFNQR